MSTPSHVSGHVALNSLGEQQILVDEHCIRIAKEKEKYAKDGNASGYPDAQQPPRRCGRFVESRGKAWKCGPSSIKAQACRNTRHAAAARLETQGITAYVSLLTRAARPPRRRRACVSRQWLLQQPRYASEQTTDNSSLTTPHTTHTPYNTDTRRSAC
jgi:hypothetical protein